MIHLRSSKIAYWHNLVIDAEHSTGYSFDENVECYLVLTLDGYTSDKTLASSVMAVDFLQAFEQSGNSLANKLRQVGDHCLLLAGFFPERALRKHVSIDYFIHIGQRAYETIASRELLTNADHQLFFKLSENFVGLMDILHVMRNISTRQKS